MSDHDSWLAVRGPSRDELLEMLGLEETGEVGWPHEVGKPYSYAPMPGGWIIIFANFYGLADIQNIRGLSRHGLVMACNFQDQVDEPCADLVAAQNGEALWEIHVLGDEVASTGTPPPEFAPMCDHYALQLVEDPGCAWMYEVPLALAKALCGFRHDEDDSPFRGLRPSPDSRWHHDLKWPANPDHKATRAGPLAWGCAIALVIIPLLFGLFDLFVGTRD